MLSRIKRIIKKRTSQSSLFSTQHFNHSNNRITHTIKAIETLTIGFKETEKVKSVNQSVSVGKRKHDTNESDPHKVWSLVDSNRMGNNTYLHHGFLHLLVQRYEQNPDIT